MGAPGYVASNALTGLAASAFQFYTGFGAGPNSTGPFTPSPDNRSYLNVGRMDKRLVVAASPSTNLNLIIDFGSATALVGIAVLNSNCAVQKTDAALRVEASSNATFAADANEAKAASTLYSAAVPQNKDHVLQWNQSLSKRYWRLTWTWTGTVTNFSIGELYAYTALTTFSNSRFPIYGSGETEDAKVAISEMQYGAQRGLFLAGPIRQLDHSWDDLNATSRNELRAMHRASNYGASPFLFVPSSEAVATAAASSEQECVFGRLQRPQFKWTEKDFRIYTPDGYSIRSEGREAGA